MLALLHGHCVSLRRSGLFRSDKYYEGDRSMIASQKICIDHTVKVVDTTAKHAVRFSETQGGAL